MTRIAASIARRARVALAVATLIVSQLGVVAHADTEIDPLKTNTTRTKCAISRANPCISIAALTGTNGGYIQVYQSTDAGLTWDEVTGHFIYGAPRGVAEVQSDDNGVFYILTDDDLYRSTDDGDTWTEMDAREGTGIADANLFDDLAIDVNPNSPYYGNLYLVTFGGTFGTAYLYHSTDDGSTWSTDVTARTDGGVNYGGSPHPDVAVGPNGDVHFVWGLDVTGSSSATGVEYRKSTNGGATFGSPLTIVANLNSELRDPPYPNPQVRVSAQTGHIFVAYSTEIGTTSPYHMDVRFQKSEDGGSTWSSPTTIHSASTDDELVGAMEIDAVTNALVLMYETGPAGASGTRNMVMAHSPDEGANWVHTTISNSGWTDYPGFFVWQEGGVDIHNGFVLPSWTTSGGDGMVDPETIDCPTNLTLGEASIEHYARYGVTNQITVDAAGSTYYTVESYNPDPVYMFAGYAVVLKPGFVAEEGCVYVAKLINSCSQFGDAPNCNQTLPRPVRSAPDRLGNDRSALALVSVKVSPEPVRDRLTVRVDVAQPLALTVELHDERGNQVRSVFVGEQREGAGEYVVDCRALASGTYFIRARWPGGSVARQVTVIH